jgi:malonyl-CoA O-methyltransferase
MTERKDRIAQAFGRVAGAYDDAADVQWRVAAMLAEMICGGVRPPPARILEIGCGTGFLSLRVAEAFPGSKLVLTDIAPTMVALCKERLGPGHEYLVIDGECPTGLAGQFDLIVSNLAIQWFVDLKGGIERLCQLLSPRGKMFFSTLGRQTFDEWRAAHERLGLACGTPIYPTADDFPWPAGFSHNIAEEFILQPYGNGQEFVRTLKALGASEPAPGYHPLSTGAFRRLLTSLEGGLAVTYHVLLGEISR